MNGSHRILYPIAERSRWLGFPTLSRRTGQTHFRQHLQWQTKQTMLINEKKLNMMDPEHRKLLEQEMVNFLFEGKEVHIEGYTPPAK